MDYLDDYKDEQDKLESLDPEQRRAVEWIAEHEGITLLSAYERLSNIYTEEVVTFEQIVNLWLKHKE